MEFSNEFRTALARLGVAKMIPPDKAMLQVYWENLGKLPHIIEAMRKAESVEFRRGFPTVSELVQLHKGIARDKAFERCADDTLELTEPRYSRERRNRMFDRLYFVMDAKAYFNIDSEAIISLIDEKITQIPYGYSKNRNKAEIEIILRLSGVSFENKQENDLEPSHVLGGLRRSENDKSS